MLTRPKRVFIGQDGLTLLFSSGRSTSVSFDQVHFVHVRKTIIPADRGGMVGYDPDNRRSMITEEVAKAIEKRYVERKGSRPATMREY